MNSPTWLACEKCLWFELLPGPQDPDAMPEFCPSCNGSGEGMNDGSTCSRCKGLGVVPNQEQADYNAEMKLDRDIQRWEDRKYGRNENA